MSVVQLDFFDREDLNGAVIFSCTDEDLFFEGFEMRIGLRDLGSGLITLSRQGVSAGDNPSFLFDVARSEAFVRVLVPAISSDYLFGFFLDSRKTHVLSDEEAAGQDIILGGSGPLYYLSRAILWNQKFSGTAATVSEDTGLWQFPDNENWTPGKIFETLVSEDTNNSFSGVPFLPALTLGFDNDDDSDGNAWTDFFDGGLQLAIGTHYLQALRIMQKQAVDLDAYIALGAPGTPLMLMEMYNRYGRDLTGTTFGAGTVLWKGGISSDPLSGNILTGIEASGQSTVKPSHVLVKGANGVYSQVDRGLWSPGDFTKAVAVDFDETSGTTSLFRYGRRIMADWDNRLDGIQFEILPGFDEALGHYMPGPPASSGHFWIGDDITLKTGGDAVHSVLDYHYTSERITGIRMVVDEASDGSTAAKAALSWHVVPELNEVFGTDGSLATGGVGICCGVNVCQDGSAFSAPTELLMKFRFRMAVTTQVHSLQLILYDFVGAAAFDFEVRNTAGAGFSNQLGISNLELTDAASNNTSGPATQGILTTVDDVWCWLRVRADTSGQAMARLWKDGTSEPGTWDVETNDPPVTWDDAAAGTLSSLTFNPTLGNAASGSSLEIESIQFTAGFTGLSDTESFTRTEAAGLGISEWNGVAYTGRTTSLAVNGTQLVDTDDGSSAEYYLDFPPNVCTVGGAASSSGSATTAAASDHEHDTVAPGGATGEVLAKVSGADWDTEWVAAGAVVSFTSIVKWGIE